MPSAGLVQSLVRPVTSPRTLRALARRRRGSSVASGGAVTEIRTTEFAGLSTKRTTGVEPATFGLGSRRSTN
jgi:hypothetical protein